MRPVSSESSYLLRWSVAIARRISILLLIVITVTILAVIFVRLAPGFGMDERQLDLRSGDQAGTDRQTRSPEILPVALNFMTGLFTGDWGVSPSLQRPVRDLFHERAPLSLQTLLAGLLLSWSISLGAALVLTSARRTVLDVCVTVAAGAFLCLPAAIISLLFLYAHGTAVMALTAILSPRLFYYFRNILQAASRQPFVLAARARGAGVFVLLWQHICRPAAGELLALAGVSVSMAISALIPVEALCDSPGIGQLVWQSAASRDLPVLIHVTVLIAMLTCAANLISDSVRTLQARRVDLSGAV